jgi:RNA ligase (TIGR02306 family)
MRKLATIRRIAAVQPIEGADAIEVVTVDGWKVVSKKGEFQVGDLCVYFEIDSVLPVCEQFEFLRKGCYVKKDWLKSETNPEGEGFRLKTIRLRGQVSQGLVVPFPEYAWNDDDFFEGADVSNHLQVVKWDPPVPATLAGKVKGNFPSFIPKTDQERIQNLSSKLHYMAEHRFEVTLKLDGSSMTVFHKEGTVGVCSRNLWLDIENDRETTFARVFFENKFDEILPLLGNYAIQGELMGPGIQGNRENLKRHEMYVFDVYNIDDCVYLSHEERIDLLSEISVLQDQRGIKDVLRHAPIIDTELYLAPEIGVQPILDLAEGPSINHPIREGLVFKSIDDPKISFKAISNQFLLKGGE